MKGYKSLNNIEMEPSALNILIGPNRSGKTNFLDLFDFLREAMEGKFMEAVRRRNGIGEIIYKNSDEKIFEIGVLFDFKNFLEIIKREGLRLFEGFPKYPIYCLSVSNNLGLPLIEEESLRLTSITLLSRRHKVSNGTHSAVFFSKDERIQDIIEGKGIGLKQIEPEELAIAQVLDKSNYPLPYIFVEWVKQWKVYKVCDVGENAEVRKPQTVMPLAPLEPDLRNLTNIIHNLYLERSKLRGYLQEIEETIRQVFPEFEGFEFRSDIGYGKIALKWKSKFFKDAEDMAVLSDGTIRFLALVTLLNLPDPPPVICIDEPEIGLHPKMMMYLAEQMKAASDHSQLFVATHSPDLLRFMDPSSVWIFDLEDGETTIKNLSEQKEIEKWLKEYTLEELWKMGIIGEKE
ncbi:MAG: AAA family ATPase [bacterium]